MTRIALDNGRSWFDADRATKYPETTRWDGSNRISAVTGSQWHHEALYITAGGQWVCNAWSQVQGEGEGYRIITPAEAAEWLILNEYTPADVTAERETPETPAQLDAESAVVALMEAREV